MDERQRSGRPTRERAPIRQLSSIGGTTTGWRSSLETNRSRGVGGFLVDTLLAAAVLVALVALLVFLS